MSDSSSSRRGALPPIGRRARVAALVPHYRCERWLEAALASLVGQTRPLDAVVVIDDASPEPPVEIVRRFPAATLLVANENSGPYRLIQSVIETTDYDAYLFQDADDWSAPERLAELLAVAEEAGAELVGSQEVRILCEEGEVMPVRYPLDVNAALAAEPASFPLLHPTSLIGRNLVVRLGGFASGLRMSGDAELLRRAAHVARVVNSPRYLYYRRKRPDALTTAAETGLRSDQRRRIQERLWDRARANAARVTRGEAPDLAPIEVAAPVALEHVTGPPLGARRRRGRPASERRSLAAAPRPVFVVGAPRSGETLLAWALAQHPAFAVLVDARWLGEIVTGAWRAFGTEPVAAAGISLDAADADVAGLGQWIDRRARGAASQDFGRAAPRWIDATPDHVLAIYGLRRLFPEARFLHVVRDPGAAVASLLQGPAYDGRFQSADAAAARWSELAAAGLAAERALGADIVLRVRHADLLDEPEAALRRCLRFLGEPFDPRCLQPLREAGSAPPVRLDLPRWAAAGTRELVAELLAPAGAGPGLAAARHDPARLALLRDAFLARCREGFADRAAWRLPRRVRELVLTAVPEGATVAVVSRGDEELLALGTRRAWHFPRLRDGTYAGYHPADGDAAVDHLEELREQGAEYLVVPATSLWWLSYYESLREHLERRSRLVGWGEGTCAVFALDGSGTDPAPGWLATIMGIAPVGEGART